LGRSGIGLPVEIIRDIDAHGSRSETPLQEVVIEQIDRLVRNLIGREEIRRNRQACRPQQERDERGPAIGDEMRLTCIDFERSRNEPNQEGHDDRQTEVGG
jgi:hypothetical protein